MEEAGRILVAVSDAATWIWAIWVVVAFVAGGPLFVRDEWRLRRAEHAHRHTARHRLGRSADICRDWPRTEGIRNYTALSTSIPTAAAASAFPACPESGRLPRLDEAIRNAGEALAFAAEDWAKLSGGPFPRIS